jgi:threonine/homoserine efflux transporter RhtA
MFENLETKGLYLLVLAAITFVEHLLFAKRWKHQELARRTMGIATVLALALPLAIRGVIDANTWLTILFAFGVAGAVTAGLYKLEEAAYRQRRVESLRGRIDDEAKKADQQ